MAAGNLEAQRVVAPIARDVTSELIDPHFLCQRACNVWVTSLQYARHGAQVRKDESACVRRDALFLSRGAGRRPTLLLLAVMFS